MERDATFIIAGAGIGGLATALALQNAGLSYRIYERDPTFESRRQGYSLTIQENGFRALEDLGVGEIVQEKGADSMISGTSTYNSAGELILSKVKRSAERFHNFAVARQYLRACLLNALKSDTIQWNKDIIRYDSAPNDSKQVRVHFADGSSAVGRALIGCDGVRSAIRRQMLGDHLNYLGVWAINGIAPHGKNPCIVNQTVQMLDGRSRLFIKPYSMDQSMWQLTFPMRVDEVIGDSMALLNRAKEAIREWHEPITRLIHDTAVEDIRAGPIFDREPLEAIEKDVACVTMLGDAVHPMSPFKGQGANQALMDAVSVVEYLMKHVDEDGGIEKAFVEFETEMLRRSQRCVLRSRSAVEFLHSDDALLTEKMSQFVGGKIRSK